MCEAIEAEIEQLDEFGPYTFGRVFGLVCRCEEAGFTDHLLRETLETLLDRFPARELSLLLNPRAHLKDKETWAIWQKVMGDWVPSSCDDGNFDDAQREVLARHGDLPSFIKNAMLNQRQRRAILDAILRPRAGRDASPTRAKS